MDAPIFVPSVNVILATQRLFCVFNIYKHTLCFLLCQAKHNTVTSEREEVRAQNSRMQTKLQDLKEDVGKMVTSNQIEVRLLY